MIEPLRQEIALHCKAFFPEPGEIVVPKGLHKRVVDFIDVLRGQVFRGEKQLEIGLGGLDFAGTQVPEGGVHVVPAADESGHRHVEQFAQLAQRLRQDGGGAAERISGFGVHYGDISVFYHPRQLAHQGYVVGEFALADAAHVAEQPFPADEAVDCDHVVGPPGKDGLGEHLEVHEGIVVAQKQEGRLPLLRSADIIDLHLVQDDVGDAEQVGQGPKEPARAHRLPGHVKTFEIVFHAGRMAIPTRWCRWAWG